MDPGFLDPGFLDPGFLDPRSSTPDFWAPDFWAPDFWAPDFWTPDFWTRDFSTRNLLTRISVSLPLSVALDARPLRLGTAALSGAPPQGAVSGGERRSARAVGGGRGQRGKAVRVVVN